MSRTWTKPWSGRGEGADPIANQFWGDRMGWVMDPSGHVWTIAILRLA